MPFHLAVEVHRVIPPWTSHSSISRCHFTQSSARSPMQDPLMPRPSPPTLASFSGFLQSLPTSRSALGGTSAYAFTTDGIASAGNPLLGCLYPLTTLRCGSDFEGDTQVTS